MHPQVCRFISDAVYDGRLEAEHDNERRTLVLGAGAHLLLRPAGIVHAAIEHEGCLQSSEPEVCWRRRSAPVRCASTALTRKAWSTP